MKQLLIMRHAKSSWSDESLTDHDRPLNPRGLANAPLMGKLVADRKCLPQLILSSTANRAHSTSKLFVDGCDTEIPIVTQRSLYHPDIDDYCEAIYSRGDENERIMIVSHNPGSEEWIYSLTRQFETMPTAAIAVIDFPNDFEWHQITRKSTGELVDVWRPKEVL